MPALAVAAALAASLAAAHPAPRSIMQDETLLLRSGPAVRDHALDEMRALGVDTVRLVPIWRDHAAAPLALRRPREPYPAGTFAALDGVLAAARARGLDVLLTPTGPGPAWASTCRGRPRARQACAPSPAAYGRFVRELGRRYPRQRLWAIWNEPNVANWLTPQFDARGVPVAPGHYRSLVRAAARALAATGHRGDTLLIGEIASIGQTRRSPHTRVMAAEPFARRLLARRVPATGFALHPYTMAAAGPVCARGGPGQLPPARLGRLRTLLDRAGRRGVVPRRLPIWFTEAGFQTNPPDPIAGVPLAAQAARINQLEWLTAGTPGVRSTAQYLLLDDSRQEGFQSGLRFASGAPKPALAAYRIAIWVQRRGRGAEVWGRVRPAVALGRQRVALQHRGRTVRTLTTNASGTLRARVGARAGRWRLRWIAPGGRAATSRAAAISRSCAAGH